jgi:DNA-binding MarR family transcriptional regulator
MTRVTTGDLTSAQLSIMFALLRRGPMWITDLAAYEYVCTPTASSAVGRLERRGLVKRFGTPSDQRAVLVDLTPHGHADLEAVRAARATVFIELLSDFGDDDLRALHDALGPLNRLVSLANCRQPQPKNVEGAADVASTR